MLSMHMTTMSPHRLKLSIVEHLGEFLELVLKLLSRLATLLNVKHVLEGVKVGRVFHKTRDIDLGADEVAEITTGVKERSHHE